MLIRKILEIPIIYDTFQFIIGGKKRQRIFKKEYIGDVSGLKVLELGCGTSDILEYFEKCDYTGVDLDKDYIKAAQKRYKDKKWAKFICADVNDFARNCQEKYDLILMTAVIHHISDEEVENCFNSIRSLLKADGRFVSFDGVYLKGMSWFERFLNDMDRGQFVRKESEYVRLNKKYFNNVSYVCRKDMTNLPFNLIIFINKL
jgi:SAM-dependent methyltransferase